MWVSEGNADHIWAREQTEVKRDAAFLALGVLVEGRR